MNVYIDLSLLVHLLIIFISYRYVAIFIVPKKRKTLQVILFNLLVLYPLIFSLFANVITILLFIIPTIFIYRKKFLKPLIFLVVLYYLFTTFISLIAKGVTIYHGIAVITNPLSTLSFVLLPIIYLLVLLVGRIAEKYCRLLEFTYSLVIECQGKVIKTRGYLDTGNTLKVAKLPVVFLTNDNDFGELKNPLDFEYVAGGISASGQGYYATIIIKKGERVSKREVLISFVNRLNFNGCPCLMNVWLVK